MGTYIASGKITTLRHEASNHTMELGTGVAEALFACCKGAEVASGLRDDIVIELENDAAPLFL